VRAIARCALTRAESRGAHQRLDYPRRDPSLDGRHVVVRGGPNASPPQQLAGGGQIDWQTWV
jgi:succinate dehydrogenase/fumarate reductase flavoprotein subunit